MHPLQDWSTRPTTTMLKAGWVLPVTAPPIRDGAVVIRDGRIEAVGPFEELGHGTYAGVAPRDLGEAALLPGFVNVHSHLELSVMRGLLEDADFRTWITRLTEIKMVRMTGDDLLDSARFGVLEAARNGVTCCADTCDSGFALDALIEAGMRGIVFQETFGPGVAQVADSLASLGENVARLDERAARQDRVRVGLSPHAPYTVSGPLFQQVAEKAVAEGRPVAIHTAESADERRFVRDGAGPFFDRLAARGIAWTPPGVSTIRYFDDLGILAVRPLLIHCVQASLDDLDLVAAAGARIAHCPKSNAKFGHGIAPLVAMLERGIATGIGTDSVASNNVCDLIDESRSAVLLARARERSAAVLTARAAIELATLGGARALGLDHEIGSIEAGKAADLCAVRLDGLHSLPVHDVETAIVFSCSGRDATLTMVGGDIVFDAEADSPSRFDQQRLFARIREIVVRISG